MQVKISSAGSLIAARRGTGCESVSAESPLAITGIVEGEYMMIYEGKPSYKLIINSNGARFRISGYDEVKEGDTISCIRKDGEVSGKKIFWYTMDSVAAPTKTAEAKATA